MTLKSMTDFVLEIEQNTPKITDFSSFTRIAYYKREMYSKIIPYANFLKQPLELWMFVPCDEEKEKCFFEDIDYDSAIVLVKCYDTIEELSNSIKNLQLTKTAIKKSGL